MTKPLVLDDIKPQDIAQELSEIFEKVADIISKGGPSPENREEVAQSLYRCSVLAKMWAQYGKWS